MNMLNRSGPSTDSGSTARHRTTTGLGAAGRNPLSSGDEGAESHARHGKGSSRCEKLVGRETRPDVPKAELRVSEESRNRPKILTLRLPCRLSEGPIRLCPGRAAGSVSNGLGAIFAFPGQTLGKTCENLLGHTSFSMWIIHSV